MKASFAFLIHPLAPWQRRLLGLRWRERALLTGGRSDAVRRVATLSVDTRMGGVTGHIIGVPDLPEELIDQRGQIGTAKPFSANADHRR